MTMTDHDRQTFAAFHAAHARADFEATSYVDLHEKVGGLVTGMVECTDPVIAREMLIQVYADGYVQGWHESKMNQLRDQGAKP